MGVLHIYVVYLFPSCPAAQEASIKILGDQVNHDAHNIILGDSNFVEHAGDRISRMDATGAGYGDRDRRSSEDWCRAFKASVLNEFEPDALTYEGAAGRSKLDRVYTNLYSAILSIRHIACSTLGHPRHLSDHKPVFFCIHAGRPPYPLRVSVRSALHLEFEHGVQEEFAEIYNGSDLAPFEKLQALKDSIRKAST